MPSENRNAAASFLRPLIVASIVIGLAGGSVMAQSDLPGFPKYHTNNQLGAPILFDFDGDGVDELLHANGDHTMDIWEAGGIAYPGWPAAAGWHTWNMTPAVGDLDGDGTFEVVTATSNYQVHAYYSDGTVVPGFPRYLGDEIPGACCLADLDDDGDMEIIVQPRGNEIYALQGDGTDMPGWPVTISINEGGSQTPAVADLDNDGTLEIITTSQGIGSLLSVFRPDGSPYPNFPITVTYTVGSPVIADLDRDGDQEIIYTVGSDLAARHHDGTMVSGFKVDCGTWTLYTSVAVGDIDRDGYVEIAFGSQNDQVYVVRHDGTFQPGWPSPPTTGSVHATPALADLDWDGDLEIVVAAPTSGTGQVYAWHHDQTDVAGFPWAKPSTFYGGVTLGDLDGDGKIDIAASGRSGSALFAWTTVLTYDATRIVHGMYRVNRHNNAVHNLFPMEAQAAVSIEAPASAARGTTITLDVEAVNGTTATISGFAGLEAETPSGQRYNIVGHVPVTLAPGQRLARSLNQVVPAFAPVGGIRFIVYLKDTAGKVLHYDASLVTVY